ncbi:hypothetical protein OGH69_02845 [Flavobacterium sp. MFBS3-15]|uniref:hypothetical protein n=1 Tax=Flavobacterium sp. MFBS3-15 TaxID=2989816 RepID=UPI002236395C|nr:hypothetical protein [Flavobacterium sp. MFBS3-15]MCW4467890.1 hypothetical protein [Flavobacterium sp. MFBS3-15]
MKIITRLLLAAALLTLSLPAMAQEYEGGLFTPGTNFEMTVVATEPVFWVNAANEANAYFETKEGITIMTMQANKKPDTGKLPKISRVSFSDYGFMLHGEDSSYFFGLGNKESEQYLKILKYAATGEIKTFEGYGIAKHYWPKDKAPALDKLKAAKSVYDVLGK